MLLWAERLWHDLKHAARLIARAPSFALIAVVSIAFGTGANIAIFSTADALLLRPLPVPDWSGLVTVGTEVKREVSTFIVSSYPDYMDVRSRARSFAGLTAFTSTFMGVSERAGAPPQVKFATIISSNYFQVLGVELAAGRTFHAGEDEEGQPPTAIIGHRLWQTMFAGDPDVVGRSLRVAGVDCRIVGVAPEAFWGLNQRYIPEAAFLPIGLWPRLAITSGVNPLTARDRDGLTVKGRLRPGVTLAEARAELDVIARDLGRIYPETNAHQTLVVNTELQVKAAADPFSTGALLLLGMLSLSVLAVACANVAGLLSSRAPIRAREIALRLAIGAGRGRIFRQLMTESLAMAILGGLGGLAVGAAGIALLGQIRYPSEVVAMPRAQIDDRTLTFALVAAMASAVVFGLVPALQATRTNLVRPLKSGEAASAGRLRLTGRHLLVATQVTLSLVLVTIALFTWQAFNTIFGDGPGFRVTQMAKLSLDPGGAGYRDAGVAGFYDRVLADARELGGVQSVTVTSAMPLFSFEMAHLVPEGHQLPEGPTRVQVIANRVDEGYFATMQIPVIAGRGFAATDTAASAAVAVVNETMASRFWPDGQALGKRIRLDAAGSPWIEIVGVVRTSKYWFPGENPQQAIYFSYRQQPPVRMVLLAATAGDSTAAIAPLRDLVHAVDPDVPVYDAQTIEEFYDARATSFGNVLLRLVAAMGLMGVVLTMTGLYGLVSYAATRRTREIGIRIAIGASPARVLAMMLRQGLSPAWLGLAVGAVLSLAAAALLAANVPIRYDYRPAMLFAIVPALVAVTALAAFVPARRASLIAPTEALRHE
jgi:predicted permease